MIVIGFLWIPAPVDSFFLYNTFHPKTLSYSTFSLEPRFFRDYTRETIGLNLDIHFFEVNIRDPVDSELKLN
jgi:hypothetical protein